MELLMVFTAIAIAVAIIANVALAVENLGTKILGNQWSWLQTVKPYAKLVINLLLVACIAAIVATFTYTKKA